MKRTVRSLVYLAAGGLALWSQTENVRAAGSTTALPTLYHVSDEEGAMFLVTHNSPIPVLSKDRYAVGDHLVFGGPLYGTQDLNRNGGTSVGTFYGEATVVKGDTSANMVLALHFNFIFPNGDQIVGQGLADWKAAAQRIAITGGTGAYEGARGTITHSLGVDNIVLMR